MSTTPYAKLLRFLRTEKKLSQLEVAKRLKLSRASYLALERGSRELTLREALVIMNLYGITLTELTDNQRPDYEKYQMMVRVLLRTAATEKITLKKTKLCQLLYLIDMRSYYETKKSMSGMRYRRYTFGPSSDVYLRMIDELEAAGEITITQIARDDYHMYEIKESRGSARKKIQHLTSQESGLIMAVFHAWQTASTNELQSFISAQTAYQNTLPGEEIPYEAILKEPAHLVS